MISRISSGCTVEIRVTREMAEFGVCLEADLNRTAYGMHVLGVIALVGSSATA